MKRLKLLGLALTLSIAGAVQADQNQRNFLIIMADDFGYAEFALSGVQPASECPPTPNLDALASQGVRFDQFRSQTICSPARESFHKGRLAGGVNGTGIGHLIGDEADPRTLFSDPNDYNITDTMKDQGYETAFIGKWHLSANINPDLFTAPLDHGYNYQAGVMRGNIDDFFSYKSFNLLGEDEESNKYATTHHIDETLTFINATTGPWMAVVCLNAPHEPYHAPPAALHTRDLSGTPTDHQLYDAMVEAMDTEIGRLLAQIDLNETTVIFLSDNGMDKDCFVGATPPVPTNRMKSTVWEGGVRVPFIIAGAGIPQGGVCDANVHITDIMATLHEASGATDPIGAETDSLSFWQNCLDPNLASPRQYTFVENFKENSEKSKLIGNYSGQHTDLGMGSVIGLTLAIEGDLHRPGNAQTITITGAVPGGTVYLLESDVLAPLNGFGGQIISWPPRVTVMGANASGNVVTQVTPTVDDQGLTRYYQAIIRVGKYWVSNAVEMHIASRRKNAAIDNNGNKLHVNFTQGIAGKNFKLYHLPSDPNEEVNLANNNAYSAIKADLLAAMQSKFGE